MSDTNCPVCKKSIRRQYWYDSDVHATVECHEECKDCGYEYSWSYGMCCLAVGDFLIGYGHNVSFNVQRKIWRLFKRHLRKARRSFVRGYRWESHVVGVPQ